MRGVELDVVNHNEKAIQIMTRFIEGKANIVAFKHDFDNNSILKETLYIDPLLRNNSTHLPSEESNIIRFIEEQNWSSAGGQLNIFGEVERFLSRYGYPFTPTKHYSDRFGFLLDIQPRWLDIMDENFLDNYVISKIPEGLTKVKRLAWCKSRLKELFKYDKNPPRWIQAPDWPIKDDKPLFFVGQLELKNEVFHDEGAIYVFLDTESGDFDTITQFY
jgi:hypothetical protein